MATELTVGVEEEFFLVDRKGFLAEQAEEALDGAEADGGDLQPELLRCQIESASEPHHTAGELLDDLRELRRRLAEGAELRHARLLATATPVRKERGRPKVAPYPRYQRMVDYLGDLVFTGMTCGCHVHVGIDDRETALRVSNHLRPWLPALLALSANSPINVGFQTGYSSSRNLLWGRWPTAGPPPYLESVDHYETLVEGLLRTEAAMDRKMIYWDIRPSEHQPTLELRVSDVAGTAEEATLYGVLTRALVAMALDEHRPAPRVPHEMLRAAIWRAARDGLEGRCPDPDTGELRTVHDILRTLRDRTASHLSRTGDLSFVDVMFDWLRANGGGAARQRAAYDRRHRFPDVIDMLAEQTLNKLGTA